jgi:signal transduction histidine kinase
VSLSYGVTSNNIQIRFIILRLHIVTRLDAIVKDLNTILEVRSGGNKIKEAVHFSELVDDIKMAVNNLIDDNGIEMTYDFSAVNDFLTIRPYLYSIFYNLITNSIKFRREHGTCLINIKSSINNDKLELLFKDNGIGIDIKKWGEEVFGLYKRFHPNIEGKGMGLFMVKAQVETLGGKIDLMSEVNGGTKFKITFEL